ncbi:MAG: glycoside hydrolase family 26 protein [Bacteroidota bacterium]
MKYFLCLLISWLVMPVLHAQTLIDPKATAETRALFINLRALSGKGVMFGQQDGDAYGVGWRNGKGTPDVFAVAGDHPAVHGWDLGKIEHGAEMNLDSVNFRKMRKWIIGNYRRGGINTISWHVDNLVSGGSAWDKTPAVKDILPGGKLHADFVKQLSRLADFLDGLNHRGKKIPIIFRPWHEHNGDWFWWGKGNCSEAEYIALWKFTVDYLRDARGLHHLIYAISPDRSRMDLADLRNSYLYAYPGDAYVDLIGLDNYHDAGYCATTEERDRKNAELTGVLTTITAIAAEKGKVAAMTETGQESIREVNWFTRVLLEPVKKAGDIKLSYILVWRNANRKHHYGPYPGHPSVPDFLDYKKDPTTFFEKDIPNPYTTNNPDRK